jgi:predicted RecB family nuclease
MKITPELFHAFLKCPTKCWLCATNESGSDNAYAEWFKAQNELYREHATERMLATSSSDEVASSASIESLKSGRWRLATNMAAQAQSDLWIVESELHVVERVPSTGRGKAAQFIPTRFIFTNKLGKDDKLLLAFDAFVLAKSLGREVKNGKIIHGDDHAMLKVRTLTLVGEVRSHLDKIATILSTPTPPDLVLNRHCAECDFQTRCRKIAIEKDDLSLLANMSAKERQKLRSKGIFTITQLSYTFRPRRRPKRQRDKNEKYHHSLKALAIREEKIHIVGTPEIKIEGTPIYLDVEGLPDRDFYYLIGLRIGNGESAVQHSLWAECLEDEGRIWREFLGIIETTEKPTLIHYGSYEKSFLQRMMERHGILNVESVAAKAITSTLNIVSVMFARIYFPTFSNGLKEIARHLGFEWSPELASAVQTIMWREKWHNDRELSIQSRLIQYNKEDCAALGLVTQELLSLQQTRSNSQENVKSNVVDVTTLKREHLYGFKRNKFFFPELDAINKAAYWDHQREKVYIKSNRRIHRALQATSRPVRHLSPNKYIQCSPPTECQLCGSKSIHKYDRAKKVVQDLKFTPSGVKRWIVQYHFHRHMCRSCGRVFVPKTRTWSGSKFGPDILSYSVYQNIELRLSQETIAQSLNKLFGLQVSIGIVRYFKINAAKIYTETYEELLSRLRVGNLLHADETKVSVDGNDGFVWVLAGLEQVAYVYTESRESDWVQTFLKDFTGVLVCDFYAGYDGINCPKQRCLVHLLRDINDDLHKFPYDEDLKRTGKAFADLVKPIIETIDQLGLKSRFLKKHLSSVNRFYKELSSASFGSEVSRKLKLRLERNREELFTFLRYDGIPWNNNNAEHAVKPFAMLRNVINGVTSAKGLGDYLILLSVCQTCKYLGVEFLDFLRSGEKDIHAFAESKHGR